MPRLFIWLFDGFNDVTLDGSLLEDSLGSYDRTVLGYFYGNKDEGSTLGVSPGYNEGEALESEEGMVTVTGEVFGSILVATDNI